ncbi:MAG: hypothetical protein OXC66_07560 [Roseovarius sp.]|nr:hypothetical protein [Roseovarius sp.]
MNEDGTSRSAIFWSASGSGTASSDALPEDPGLERALAAGATLRARRKASGEGTMKAGHWPFPRGTGERGDGGIVWLSRASGRSSGAGPRSRRHAGPARAAPAFRTIASSPGRA